MQQLDFISNRLTINRDQLSLRLLPNFLSAAEADTLLDEFLETTPWQQPRVKVYGKWHLTPRLLCFYGESGIDYTYSNTLHETQAWTPRLLELNKRVEQASTHHFNSVLLNYYRNGQDTMGWHADDEKELGPQPCIVSLSLGAARDIHFRHKTKRIEKIKINLPAGSMLIMDGKTQQAWQHHIPKRANCSEARINLTFRMVYSPQS